MSKPFSTLLLLLFVSIFSIAQDSELQGAIKQFSLKDYEAPDILFKQFNLNTELDGSGRESGKNTYNRFSGNLGGNFNSYKNTERYQGSNFSSARFRSVINNSKDESVRAKDKSQNMYLGYSSQNRWYVSPKHFYAIHPNVNYTYSHGKYYSQVDSIINEDENKEHLFRVSAILSVGTGRIQPISPAREALNILISLEKYNRLAISPDSVAIDSLARIANKIQFKRFYDRRYKRVYQLEELDKGLKGLGLVTNTDMVYAANLSDIWSFGLNYARGSGSRFEVGILPAVYYRYAGRKSINSENSDEESTISGYGFVSWRNEVPISFAFQSDYSVTLSVGYGENNNTIGYPVSADTSGFFAQVLSVAYELGYYPNTRTFIGISPYATLSANQYKPADKKEEFIGLLSGIDLNSYYYVSPRFRVTINARCSFQSDDYINNGATPTHELDINSLSRTFNGNLSGNNNFRYNYNMGLSYAIF